jgi:hypothetical protein
MQLLVISKRVLPLLLSLTLVSAQPPAFVKVTVIDGDGAFNDMKHGASHPLVIELRDAADQPLAGAKVTFTLPFSGPSGVFADGTRTSTVTTDARGQAKADTFKPNQEEGRFNIKVTAEVNGQKTEAVVGQSNTLAGGDLSQHKGGSKKLWFLLLAAGGAGGAFAAVHGGSHSSAAPGVAPTTVSVGGITVGGPH